MALVRAVRLSSVHCRGLRFIERVQARMAAEVFKYLAKQYKLYLEELRLPFQHVASS